jgi:hypothetical protein
MWTSEQYVTRCVSVVGRARFGKYVPSRNSHPTGTCSAFDNPYAAAHEDLDTTVAYLARLNSVRSLRGLLRGLLGLRGLLRGRLLRGLLRGRLLRCQGCIVGGPLGRVVARGFGGLRGGGRLVRRGHVTTISFPGLRNPHRAPVRGLL